jgi:hypothetical protein
MTHIDFGCNVSVDISQPKDAGGRDDLQKVLKIPLYSAGRICTRSFTRSYRQLQLTLDNRPQTSGRYLR